MAQGEARPLTRALFWTAAAALSLWALWANVSPDFTPFRSELADARGFSRGLLNLVVLRKDAAFGRVPAWALVIAALGFALTAIPRPKTARGRVAAGLEVVALLLLAVAVVSPYVTPFRLVFAPRTFVLLALLVSLTRLRDMVPAVQTRWRALGSTARLGFVSVVAAGFFCSMMLQQLATYHGNYSGFLHMSRRYATGAPFLQERPELAATLLTSDEGYDGQFMYLIAFDPFMQRFNNAAVYRRVVDDPPYRYSRIGFPWLARMLSGGVPERFPAALVWLTVLAHIPLAFALAAMASRAGPSLASAPLAALLYLLIPSFAVSTAFALPEALAAAGLMGGLALWQREKFLWATLCFGASLLVRETGALLILVLLASTLPYDRRRAVWLAAAFVPVALWRAFVASRLFGEFGSHAILTNPGDFALPFSGLARLMRAGFSGTQPAPEVLAAMIFPGVLVFALALAVWSLIVRRGPLEFAAAGYGLVAVSLNYDKIWSHVPSGERGVFELFLLLLVLYLQPAAPGPAEAGHYVRLSLRRAFVALFVTLAVYTFYISPEASASRAALLLIR